MRRLSLVLVLLFALSSLGGCNKVDKWLGCNWTTTVTAPEQGTPEWVLQQAIEAAMMDDESAAWAKFRGLLHSEQLDSPASEKTWRTMNFATFRRKVPLYLEDDAKPVFEVCYTDTHPREGLRLFVKNEKSEMPTPCKVEKDPKADGAWRITLCSL